MLDGKDEPQVHQGASATPAQPSTAKLLVIDDDTVHRMIICRIATRAGLAPTGAASYEEALTMLHDNEYAAITLDLSLGQHGGVEILHYLFALGSTTPIIIISGSNEAIRNETIGYAQALNLNVYQALAKPVDLAHLREILTQLRTRSAVGLTLIHCDGAA